MKILIGNSVKGSVLRMNFGRVPMPLDFLRLWNKNGESLGHCVFLLPVLLVLCCTKVCLSLFFLHQQL